LTDNAKLLIVSKISVGNHQNKVLADIKQTVYQSSNELVDM